MSSLYFSLLILAAFFLLMGFWGFGVLGQDGAAVLGVICGCVEVDAAKGRMGAQWVLDREWRWLKLMHVAFGSAVVVGDKGSMAGRLCVFTALIGSPNHGVSEWRIVWC